MAKLTDVFTPEGFDVVSLTAAIQKMPPAPTTIAQLGIFEEEGITGTLVAVEEYEGVLTVVPTTKRDGPGVPSRAGKRKLRPFSVPHIQLDDTVGSSDVLNVRSFGSSEPMSGVNEVVERKLASMRRSIDATNEYLRMGALHGTVTYPTNSVDAALNLFTEFGTTEQTVDLVLSTTGTKVIQDKIPLIRDAVEAALGGTPYTGIVALCGRTFFRTLIGHPEVNALYLQQQNRLLGAQLGSVTFREINRQMVELGGVLFIEYYGSVGGATFINPLHARAFPIGADIFKTIYAPADLPEAVGTIGQAMYARQYLSEDQKRVHLEAQCNPLHICTRPRAMVKLIRHTGDD